MSMKQKDAVFAAVSSVKGSDSFSEAVTLSKEERATVATELFDGIRNGSVAYAGDASNTDALNSYISGLVSNWLRKDTRLNGGTKYQAKNPGTRTGSGDEPLKAMKALLNSTDDADAKAEIQRAIANRISELKPRKVINVAALPAELVKYAPQPS